MTEPQPLNLPAPPGYTQLVPFSRDAFRGMGRLRERPAAFAQSLNSLLITAVEFFQAARHYPLVFGRDTTTEHYVPVAVTGLEDGQNLFVDDTGRWRAGSYVPAYVRRWPFFTVQLKDEQQKSLVCVDPAGLTASEQPFIDAAGEPTATWRDAERMINEMDAARRQTQLLMQTLADFELMEPFEAHAIAHQGGHLRLANMHRVSEQKLNRLPEKHVKQLMAKGWLSRVYAHLMSLDNFQRLLDLRLERQQPKGEA